jgi:Ca-activated chloride channel family protein
MVVGAILLAGCASRGAAGPQLAAKVGEPAKPVVSDDPKPVANPGGAWIGAATESDLVLASGGDQYVGVWVDAPAAAPRVRAPVDVALVIDTSGSMRGDKIESARAAATALVSSLADGDIVSIDTFSERAMILVPPTLLDARSRSRILGTISEITPQGPTNMCDGLSFGEMHVAQAPADHPVRRVVVISDGIANVGPSSPTELGALAASGLRHRAQVTSLGVGNDYDENTLNALSVRTNGRLFHLSDPKEMAAILASEVKLLGATVASDAFVEIVPAPGVQIVGAELVPVEPMGGGAVRIPLGALYGGQHRELLVRARFGAMRVADGPRAIASVRLHYHDPNDGDLDRLQETVLRATPTDDPNAMALHPNAKTQSIVAMQTSAKMQMQAAQQVNSGDFRAADAQLAQAEEQLKKGAAVTKDENEKKRLQVAAGQVARARAATQGAAAAPAPAKRDQALQLNGAGMKDLGY